MCAYNQLSALQFRPSKIGSMLVESLGETAGAVAKLSFENLYTGWGDVLVDKV